MSHLVETATDVSSLVGSCYLGMLSSSRLTRNHQEKQAGNYLITKTCSSSKSIPVVSSWSLCFYSKQNYIIMSPFASSFFINIWVLLTFFPSCTLPLFFLESILHCFLARVASVLEFSCVYRGPSEDKPRTSTVQTAQRATDRQTHSLIH